MAKGLKEKLGAGQPVVVVNPDHPSPGLVQFIGRLPVDAVFIDCEQGSAGIETMENMVRAARVGGLGSLVRLFSPDDWVIERYMLRGVDGIVVPRIDTAEAARRVVAAEGQVPLADLAESDGPDAREVDARGGRPGGADIDGWRSAVRVDPIASERPADATARRGRNGF